jgi:hypothetical protein
MCSYAVLGHDHKTADRVLDSTGAVFEIIDAAAAARRHKPQYEETNL